MFGHDVELFLKDSTNKPVPSCGLLGGKKGAPVKVSQYTSLLEDGVTCELNGPPVGADSFGALVERQSQEIEKYLHDKGLSFFCAPASKFTKEQLSAPQANTIGCSQDFDAFGEELPRDIPNIKQWRTTRFAGGHIHVSLVNYPNWQLIPIYAYVRFTAAFVTLPMLRLDKQGARRKVYGLPGLHRPTTYPNGAQGFEYRAFSDFWFSDPHCARSIVNSMHTLFKAMAAHPENVRRDHSTIPWADINNAIINEDEEMGGQITSYLNDTFPQYGVA